MRIIFFGTPEFALPSLELLISSEEEIIAVVSQPDKRRERISISSPTPVKELALKNGLNFLQPTNIKSQVFIDELRNLNPDLIIVVAYGKILPLEILQIPKFGCINLHASLLPKYRGAAPIQWAIINGEKITGITTMFMDEGLDTGDILLQEEIEISSDDTAETLSKKLAKSGASLLMKTIIKIKDRSITPIAQTGIPSYAPPLKKEDGKIVWSKTSQEIFNFVRGMYPWPGAYCYLDEKRIKILRVSILEGNGKPGRIEKAEKELIVGTGKGLISILELQPEGKKPMTANAFIQGRKVKEGSFFDKP